MFSSLLFLSFGVGDALRFHKIASLGLRGDGRPSWQRNNFRRLARVFNYDEDQAPYRPDAESLKRFLESEVLSWYEKRRRELEHRALIRAQAFGEAVEPERLERLARYEVHLDRKLERTVAMLLKLQQLRSEANPT